MVHYEPSHLDQHCLHKYLFWSAWLKVYQYHTNLPSYTSKPAAPQVALDGIVPKVLQVIRFCKQLLILQTEIKFILLTNPTVTTSTLVKTVLPLLEPVSITIKLNATIQVKNDQWTMKCRSWSQNDITMFELLLGWKCLSSF